MDRSFADHLKMPKLKSERHHWWPECVSDYWKDSEGLAHWILPDGETRHSPPKNFGVIGNGHYIKLSRDPHEATVWDQNFEDEFGRADSHLRGVIEWLESLDRVDRRNAKDLGSRFLRQDACDENVGLLVEGLVSLAVRSPINRESAVGLAEKLRGSLPERERNAIMGSNMRGCQRRTVELDRNSRQVRRHVLAGSGIYLRRWIFSQYKGTRAQSLEYKNPRAGYAAYQRPVRQPNAVHR